MQKSIVVRLALTILLIFTGCTSQPQKTEKKGSFFIPQKTIEYTQKLHISAPWNRELYESAYPVARQNPAEVKEPIKGAIIPHHLISAPAIAKVFETVKKQDPSLIVLIGPNHFDQGTQNILSTVLDWKTLYGKHKTDAPFVEKLFDRGVLGIEDAPFDEEHSMYSLIPFFATSTPDAPVVPIMLKESATQEELDQLAFALIEELPDDAVLLSTIDFSHYQRLPVANFHDELSINVIENFDYERIEDIEIDSKASLYTMLKLMEHQGAQHIAFAEHTNSAIISGNRNEWESTSHYIPYFVQGEPKDTPAVSILAFGDMMLDRDVARRIQENGGAEYLFKHLAGREERFFQGSDIVMANLEGAMVQHRIDTSKSIAFRFDPALISPLQHYGFNLFTLANNHTLDMGRAGFEETKQHLTDAGIPHFGNQFTVADDSLLIQKIADKTIAHIGLNDTHNSMDMDTVRGLFTQASSADYIVVNIHWGQEYKELSNQRQRDLAHEFIDLGADAVIGHHPHVVQEMEIYNNKPIFYSLGNFMFDQYFSVPTQQSLGVGLVLYPDKISVSVFPLKGVRSQVQYMNQKEEKQFLNAFFDRSRLGEYTFTHNQLTIF